MILFSIWLYMILYRAETGKKNIYYIYWVLFLIWRGGVISLSVASIWSRHILASFSMSADSSATPSVEMGGKTRQKIKIRWIKKIYIYQNQRQFFTSTAKSASIKSLFFGTINFIIIWNDNGNNWDTSLNSHVECALFER